MKYISTRGNASELNFEEVVLAGLAEDGGLYVPAEIPQFTPEQISGFAKLSYADLAYEIIAPYTGGMIAEKDLRAIINGAYSNFRHEDIAPLKKLDDTTFVLELFHGPTLAFKDFALQFLGRLLDNILQKRQQKVVVVGATSGDTGSAAIAGCQGRDNMDIFILHPKGRVSDVQRKQMTTIQDKNVHNIAIDGTFDDCQDIVKALFNDLPFKNARKLTAVNSINWARILAQLVYYFYAALRLGAPATTLSFSVPTGNFGDIYAGYLAKHMGLPIDQLIIATNRNDILARCVDSGDYTMQGVVASESPSMDIQISSNFERLLFGYYDRDGKAIAEKMKSLRSEHTLKLSPEAYGKLKSEFASKAVNDEETLAIIKEVYEATGELLDPHTATGYGAGKAMRSSETNPLVILATAHPAKFPSAAQKAVNVAPALPAHLSDLFEREERFDSLPNETQAVKDYIETTLS